MINTTKTTNIIEPLINRYTDLGYEPILKMAILVCSAFLLLGPVRDSASADPPNVILMMADDLGWKDTGFNGHPFLKTPGLDAMARNGMRFQRFYAAAPVCSPTRGSCLTGRHPFRYGVFFANTGHLRKQEFTIAEYVKQQGYVTGHFGKWHLGTLTKTVKDSNRGGPSGAGHYSPPSANGFDEYFSTEAKTPTYDPLIKPKSKSSRNYWLPVKDPDQSEPYGTRYWKNGEPATDLAGDDSRIIMDQALRFINDSRERRFLAVIWFHAPHLPVVASAEDRKPFANRSLYDQSYFGCIRALDRQVARLRTELKKLKLDQDTLVCFCSDNGPEGNNKAPGSAGQFRGRKRSLYEGGVRVPAVIEWPGTIPAGSITEHVAVTSDYLPTVVELTGGKLPERPIDGVSLVPVFKTPSLRRSRPVFFESRNMASCIEQRFKLVVRVQPGSTKVSNIELYDLQTDPGEKRNVADRYPEQVARMVGELKDWRQSCRDSLDGKDYQR